MCRITMQRKSSVISLFLFLSLGCFSCACFAQPSETILELRRRFLDPDINSLTFHNIDEIFTTQRVPAGAETWVIPSAPKTLNFSYQFNGATIDAADFAERTYTNALLIIKHGNIVFERYLNQTNGNTHFLSMSMAKSITSILIGMAVSDGLIRSVDDKIIQYVPELENSGYRDVTIRQALQMRSGVGWDERYDFEKQTPMAKLHHGSIVENRIRFVSAALNLQALHPPGEVFNYSTVETTVLGWVLERATGLPLIQYMSERWWRPAGMQSYGFWLFDGSPGMGNPVNGMGFNATLRDFGRIGLMMLQNGKAFGRQLLPSEWVAESTTPAEETLAPGLSRGYAYQWWTLADSPAYMAVGLQGQFIYVDPDSDTVAVKLSYFPPGEQRAGAESEAFFRALSNWSPE